ncbi:MAG: rod shape-determining protein MreD [Flavobacteriales bacterium]
MGGETLRNFFRFVILILLQAMIFDHWTLEWGVQPFIYILFILMLPFETQPWLVMILGFITGLGMDAFENTEGMHASATTLMAFIRKPLLERIAPRDGYESGDRPTIPSMGFPWFLRYTAILALIHHTWLYGLAQFRLDALFIILRNGIFSAAFTLILLIIYQYLIHGSPSRGRR